MDQLLIVGGGLAGTLIAMECHERGIGFKWVVADHIPTASFAAYGMCNPVHLRNQVPVWNAHELYQTSKTFFAKWSKKLRIEVYSPMPVNHMVTDEMEEVKWRQSSEVTDLWKYTTGEPEHHVHPLLSRDFISEIRIKEAFYLNLPLLITTMRTMLKDQIINGEMEWNRFELNAEHVIYRNQSFRKVILADGVGGMKNPYFNYVPFNPCKGEVLHINIQGLRLHEAVHKKIVLVPLADRSFSCGATYEWSDLSDQTTSAAKEELLQHLNIILGNRYKVEVIGQVAGVRPAIADRRPVVGWHPKYSAVGILNGFGTRGLLVGPSTCKNLLDNHLNGNPILSEWDVQRFNKRFAKK